MDNQRRHFLKAVVPGALLASAGFVSLKSTAAFAQQGSNPPSRVNPNPAIPPPLSPFHPPSKAELQKNQREINKDVDQLFSLAQQLKRQADKNDASQELSVALIEKTEEIEKLAKKIRDLARY
jgi:hypothetical protein